jgi:uncharacterized protein YbbC (DUF1343 family)/CubicO group peptidase (beta-lactamase class C family)
MRKSTDRVSLLALLTALTLAAAPAKDRPRTVAAPQSSFRAGAALDALIQEAIRKDQIPGAVLLVGHQGKVVYRKAYGSRALTPRREAMTLNTIFDAASLTKVVATTPALMKLFEQGKLRLNDRVTQYLPEFQGGSSEITVRNLLTHFSGMRPDLDLQPAWSGYETGIRLALADKPVAPPGARFIYSDINFILLGEIVRRVSGQRLPDFAREKVFAPLGMKDSMFQPPARLRPRIAPTELVDGKALRGVVHDETTRYMDGVAGHAGLFTTADDLARYAEMLLGGGKRGRAQIFSPLTVLKFTTPETPPDQPILRGLGWDLDSPYSGNRGELFPIGSYGHTGFTGTSLWIDPVSQTYVILLSNSVHPHRRPAITGLRGKVATVVAAELGIEAPGIQITGYNETLIGAGVRRVVARNAEVLTGLDVLKEQQFAVLRDKRVGLITNHTGLDRDGKRNVDLMLAAGIQVKALFSPEHGITGREDPEPGDISPSLSGPVPQSRPQPPATEASPQATDPATGIPIWSLYSGKSRRPSEEMLRDIDALVFDIQDVGARFYTYTTTMAYALEEAARARIPFYVLDRPNPITGVHLEGPVLDADLLSFIGYFPLPLRHAMTVGELALLFNAANRLRAELHVIPLKNWQRGDWFDSTNLVWIDPSPNLRSLNAALLYPGVAMLEGSGNYSVGRGTDAPFEQIGADWINGRQLAAYLDARFVPGVRFYPTRFRPTASHLAGQLIEGVRFVITDREIFDSARLGLEIAAALQKLYPNRIAFDRNRRLIGSQRIIEGLERGDDPRRLQESGEESLLDFSKLREEYLLYR